MIPKKYAMFLTAAAILFFAAGCNEIDQTAPELDILSVEYSTTEAVTESVVTTVATTTASTTVSTELTGPEYTQIPLDIPEIDTEEFELVIQAESQELPDAFETMNEKADYTGSGYISGLSGELENTFAFNAELPSTQHYDISIVVCAEEGAECIVSVNDEEIEDIVIESSDGFISATIPGIYIEAGDNRISIQQKSGDMLLDCLEIRNNTSFMPDTSASFSMINENASPEAKKLFEFICDNYGKAIISGQHVSGSDNSEIARIVKTSGKYPAVRFADMYSYSCNSSSSAERDETVGAALEWSSSGGITGFMWHWFAPMGEMDILEKSDDFSLSDAVTFENIACLTPKALDELQKKGDISRECVKLIADIDSVSEGLKKLRDANIPVLWRPLHQAGTGDYWWDSEGCDVYLWLWDLLYRRMTEYHGLDNLLWVWSGVDVQYLPDSSQYDIATADIYLTEEETFGSGYTSYYALRKMTDGKLIALSECSSLPDIAIAFRDGSVWSYFGLWYEPYLEKEDNEFVDSETLISVYNSEGVLTREDYVEYCRQHVTS
ncbi:MAG: hypothetical protein K2H01_12785 [Ruminococcus sp.]|nr:hypothetical protein [Ruminococcus sp.]